MPIDWNKEVLTSKSYDPRWFIWITIVLFVVAGSIITYLTVMSIELDSQLFLETQVTKPALDKL